MFINDKGHIEFASPLRINKYMYCRIKLWVDVENDRIVGEAWLERKTD